MGAFVGTPSSSYFSSYLPPTPRSWSFVWKSVHFFCKTYYFCRSNLSVLLSIKTLLNFSLFCLWESSYSLIISASCDDFLISLTKVFSATLKALFLVWNDIGYFWVDERFGLSLMLSILFRLLVLVYYEVAIPKNLRSTS